MLQLSYIFDNWLYLHLNSLLNMNQGVPTPPPLFCKNRKSIKQKKLNKNNGAENSPPPPPPLKNLQRGPWLEYEYFTSHKQFESRLYYPCSF